MADPAPIPTPRPEPALHPDVPAPAKLLDQLFAKRPHQPLVAGHALFRTTAPPSPTAPVAAPVATQRAHSKTWLHRLTSSWKSFGHSRHTAVVGIDLGASAIKVVRVERTGSTPRVTGLACEEYPLRAEGRIQEEVLEQHLREMKRRGLLDGQLVLGFTNARVMAELVTMPKMPLADINRAVLWEAKERLSAEPPAYCIRHLVVGETTVDGQPKHEVVIIVAPREEIVSQWSKFTEQGFSILAVEPGILASVAACEAAGMWRPQDFVGILEIGRRSSTLALIVQGAVRFIRAFPVAGDSITQSIVDYCQVDYEAAESQKREIGLSQMALEEDRRATGLEAEPRVRVSHALGLYLERLAAEVEHSLRYFTYELGHAKDLRLEVLYLCGGGALLKNLGAFLSSRTNTRVEVADPFTRCAISEAATQQLRASSAGPRLTEALGLALRPLERP